MTRVDQVRALFVPGESVECVENTYIPARNGMRQTIASVGKSVYEIADGGNFRGTFPTRSGDIVHVDESSATWKIGRDDHTVTYRKVVQS